MVDLTGLGLVSKQNRASKKGGEEGNQEWWRKAKGGSGVEGGSTRLTIEGLLAVGK